MEDLLLTLHGTQPLALSSPLLQFRGVQRPARPSQGITRGHRSAVLGKMLALKHRGCVQCPVIPELYLFHLKTLKRQKEHFRHMFGELTESGVCKNFCPLVFKT